jgi:transcription-repair coupling factor (superfamily II helicase)
VKNLLKITITLAVLLAVGCATAPEPEPAAEPAPQEKPAPPPEPVAETPNPAAESRATAQQLRSVVERNKFGDEAPKTYAAAETAFESAEKVYDSAPEQANTLYTDAATNYRLVIDEGARKKAERARADVQAKREQARSVKAEVAQKQRYNQAEADPGWNRNSTKRRLPLLTQPDGGSTPHTPPPETSANGHCEPWKSWTRA